jgi:Flp pilus assembly protein TadD
LERALEFYTNAAELDPLNKEALQLKGLALKKLKKFEEAESALK